MDAEELNSSIENSDDDEGERLNLEGNYSSTEFANSNTNQTLSKVKLMPCTEKKRNNIDDTEALSKNISLDLNTKKVTKKTHLPYKYFGNEVKPKKIKPKIVNPDNDFHLIIQGSEDNDALQMSNQYTNTEVTNDDLENSETSSKGLAFHKNADQAPSLV